MGGQQSAESPEEAKVEEKAEAPKAEAQETPEKETKEKKLSEKPEKAKAPVPPGAQNAGPLAKAPAKPPKAAAKKKQPGPPQQPGLITPESGKKGKGQGEKREKGEKGEKGKGGKKGGNFPGIQLCVRNLAKETSPEQLKAMFLPFGELLNVDAKKNTDGTCRGYGFVTFAKMDDAKKAIDGMDGKPADGKNLVVVLSDRQQGTSKAEREAGKGKGKEAKGEAKGKGAKGKTKQGAPAAQPTWPYAQGGESYPYNYGGYPMVSPMSYPNQPGYNSQQAAAMALQAQMLQAHQAIQQSQAAWYSQLNQMSNPVSLQQAVQAPTSAPTTVSLAAAAPPPSTETPNLNQEHEGTLKSISAKNGYGFIACDEMKAHYKRDVFVDSSLLPEGVQVNDKVAFSLALSEKGHPRATSVKLVGQVVAR